MVQINEEITVQEQELINQLGERVNNELPESFTSMTKEDQDLYLVRWIRARDLHLDNATKMLRSSIEWRKERDAEKATKFTIHPFLKESYSFKFAGPDKRGRPVLLAPLAQWDFRKIINNQELLEEFDNFVTYCFETLCSKIREEHVKRSDNGHLPITQFLMIFDAKDYPYGQLLSFAAMKKFLLMGSVYEAHYPEILFKGFYINCPSFFNLFINMLKLVLAPKTLGKLTCYSDITAWQKDMEELVDPAKIPVQYGGTADDDSYPDG